MTTEQNSDPGRLLSAQYKRSFKIFLMFADGFSGTWAFERLGLNMLNMEVETVRVSTSGDSIKVLSNQDELVVIDASTLRATVDPEYKAQRDKELGGLLNEELRALTTKQRNPT